MYMDGMLKMLNEFEYRRERLLEEAQIERERREKTRKLEEAQPQEVLQKAA